MNATIKLLREQKGYSQTYLASYLEVSRQMYIKYETGEVEPPVRVIKALSKLYNISYSIIIDDQLFEKNEFQYKAKNQTDCKIAESSPVYNNSKQENLQTAKLISQVQKLPQKYIPAISAFILLLQQEEKTARQNKKIEKSKNAFFSLAGKINLDEDEVTAFRQASLI